MSSQTSLRIANNLVIRLVGRPSFSWRVHSRGGKFTHVAVWDTVAWFTQCGRIIHGVVCVDEPTKTYPQCKRCYP